ncbi:exopolysaccharide biosynthesis protein [Isoalcanivorax indicus]|uniref:exopolysaccharide biosynthesis protein n=1 Tax=Isoalcanivorax indicus TaxID=2202653 RepID=UPI000DBA6DC6|nr:exopolysaccharide biosynthesis protein [Isoalcanivorax indicus]
MDTTGEAHNLEALIQQIRDASETSGEVSIGQIMEAIGRRSFGPILLFAGVITLVPVIGGIPGVPTAVAILVLIVAAQLIVKRDRVWLPDWLLQRAVSRDKVLKALGWCERPADWLDRIMKPRLEVFVEGTAFYVMTALCIAVAAMMPVMELVPFSAIAAGAALTAMGLSLIARDGVWAIIAIVIVLIGVAGLLYYFL